MERGSRLGPCAPLQNLDPRCGILYFSEGLPYGIATDLFPLYLRLQHVGLGEIGLREVHTA